MSINQLFSILKGGPTSGNFGHSGIPGHVGGSTPSSLVIPSSEIKNFTKDSKIKDIIYTGRSKEGAERIKRGEFDPEKAGANVWQGSAIYFGLNKSTADKYGEKTISAVVNIKKPFVGKVEEIEKKISSFNIQPPKVKLPNGQELEARAWMTVGQEKSAIRDKWLSEGYDSIVQLGNDGKPFVIGVFNPSSIRVIED